MLKRLLVASGAAAFLLWPHSAAAQQNQQAFTVTVCGTPPSGFGPTGSYQAGGWYPLTQDTTGTLCTAGGGGGGGGNVTIVSPLGTQTVGASVAVTDLSLQPGGSALTAIQAGTAATGPGNTPTSAVLFGGQDSVASTTFDPVTIQHSTNGLQVYLAGGVAQPITGYDSGQVTATATPANSSHAAGTSNGGLFSLSFFRTNGNSGEIGNLMWISTNGSTGSLVIRLWQKNPTSTTCTDNSPFVGSITDDVNLVVPPFTITPAAPGSVTGDAKTYASYQFTPPLSALNGSSNTTLYACAVNVATNTADNNHAVYIGVSGAQN
jgi:hypothetical protein